jgi:LacI family transcriptional regulator, galactose operon repressor
MPRSQPATISDVAKQARVSIATVSRVLNGTTPVTEERAARVREAIAGLNYVPRAAARVLASRRTNMIGLLLPEIGGAFFQLMLRGVEAGVREAGFDLLIHATHMPHDGIAPRRALGEHNTDGLILFTDSVDLDEVRHLHSVGHPAVLMHRSSPDDLNIPMITVENKSGAYQAVRHLIEVHGRRRIAFLRGIEDQEDAAWRERGYREALEEVGLTFDPALVGQGDFDSAAAQDTVRGWLRDGIALDAIFAADDESARGAMAALRAAGKRIPQDVAVVGFDDVTFASFLIPPLTTVRAPIEQVGREAVRQLVKLIRSGAADPQTLLPTELIIRESCGCTPDHA